jgi:hypothetical protein
MLLREHDAAEIIVGGGSAGGDRATHGTTAFRFRPRPCSCRPRWI